MSYYKEETRSLSDVSVRDILQYLYAIQGLVRAIENEPTIITGEVDKVQEAMSNLYIKLKSNSILRKVVMQSSQEQIQELESLR